MQTQSLCAKEKELEIFLFYKIESSFEIADQYPK